MAKTIYEVWFINDRGTYSLMTTTESAGQAAMLKNGLVKRGIFAQVCKHGENTI